MPVGEADDMTDVEHARLRARLLVEYENVRLFSRLLQIADYVVRKEGDWWTVLDPDGARIRVAPVGEGDHERSAMDVLDGLIDSAAARHRPEEKR